MIPPAQRISAIPRQLPQKTANPQILPKTKPANKFTKKAGFKDILQAKCHIDDKF